MVHDVGAASGMSGTCWSMVLSHELLAADNPISSLKVFDLREAWRMAVARRACGCAWC